eukprot:5912160-Pleurochrysis_carterae.AAC.2
MGATQAPFARQFKRLFARHPSLSSDRTLFRGLFLLIMIRTESACPPFLPADVAQSALMLSLQRFSSCNSVICYARRLCPYCSVSSSKVVQNPRGRDKCAGK